MNARSSAIRVAIVALAAARALLAPVAVDAQSAPRASTIASGAQRATSGANTADSIATLLKARVAQRKFEQVRRANLPITDAYPSSRCDVRVGRFCYWHDEDFVPPREPERTAAERKKFLARLADAGAAH